MPVSSSYFSPLRFFETGDKPAQATRLDIDQRYDCGTQLIECSSISSASPSKIPRDPRVAGILRIIENFNAEPLFVGNGLFLFNRTSRFFVAGGTLTPHEAVDLLERDNSILLRLARVRPAQGEDSHSLVQIVPIRDFNYQISSTPAFISWWQSVGRNFHDGVF